MDVDIKFPPALNFLFKPARYKVARGGRGSGKSWGFARALLVLAANEKLRILCTREVQKSIKDSVHRLLSDQIDAMGLGGFFAVFETEIKGRNGSTFLFSGLSSQTVESIKSNEGIDIVWCEEAQSITEKSWSILIPTIRRDDSEIWVTFNPELDTDPTYVRFVSSPPPDCISVLINYTDNPWFPTVLEQERIHCQLTNKEDYAQIWEGKCRSAVSGAIYASEIGDAIINDRICNVPYDPRLKVHTIWDLGWNDSMAISLVQRVRSEIRIIDYIEDSHKTLDWYVTELKSKRMNWGIDYLPHDGRTKNIQTGKSAQEVLKSFDRSVKIVPSVGVEDGIKAARMMCRQVYFDKQKTGRLVECLKRYRRSINQATNEPGAPVHDEFSHGADNFRYLAVVADQLKNEAEQSEYVEPWKPLDSVMGY